MLVISDLINELTKELTKEPTYDEKGIRIPDQITDDEAQAIIAQLEPYKAFLSPKESRIYFYMWRAINAPDANKEVSRNGARTGTTSIREEAINMKRTILDVPESYSEEFLSRRDRIIALFELAKSFGTFYRF